MHAYVGGLLGTSPVQLGPVNSVMGVAQAIIFLAILLSGLGMMVGSCLLSLPP